jgi:hypothetical protein
MAWVANPLTKSFIIVFLQMPGRAFGVGKKKPLPSGEGGG